MGNQRERGLKQLPDGRWQFSWCFEGRYHRRIAETKGEARAYLQKIHTQIREGKYLEVKKEDRLLFDDAVKAFLSWSKTNKRTGTYETDVWASNLWLESRHLAGKPITRITGEDVERWRQELATKTHRWGRGSIKELPGNRWRASWVRAGKWNRFIFPSKAQAEARLAEALKDEPPKPLTKRAQDIALARLKRLFSLRVEWGLTETNPVAKVKLYRDDNERLRFLTDEEEVRLLAACPPYLARIVRFALETGARRGEILGLRWADVDLANRVATLDGTLAKGRRTRHIFLNQGAVSVLKELPRPIDRSIPVFAEPVIPSTEEKGQSDEALEWRLPARIEQHWQQAVDRAELGDFHFHDLRHTFASRLVQSGVDLAVLRELLGHRDFKMTLRYSHLAPSHLKSAVAVLDDRKLRLTCNAKTAPRGAVSGVSRNSLEFKA